MLTARGGIDEERNQERSNGFSREADKGRGGQRSFETAGRTTNFPGNHDDALASLAIGIVAIPARRRCSRDGDALVLSLVADEMRRKTRSGSNKTGRPGAGD